MIVIDKPAGLLTTHTKVVGRAAREAQLTAENLLNDYVRKGQLRSRNRVCLVHRLDRETSGVMMFAKSEAVAEYFRSNWNEITEKTYVARVHGVITDAQGVFESRLAEDADGYRVRSVKSGGRLARTEWRTIAPTPPGKSGFTLVEVSLKSGRKNQIRVHFSEAGHPVVGDVKYGGPESDRLYLHAVRLRFRHPHDSRWLEFNSPSPF